MQIEKEQEGELLRVSCGDGKYTVIQYSKGRTVALRYGEPWMEVTGTAGSNMILALAYDLDDARKAAAENLEDANAWCRVATEVMRVKAKLARALRWVFKNGMHPDYDRPAHVNEAFNEAWEGHRGTNPWRQRLGEPET